MSPEFDDVRRALEALTPEQRKRFQENLLRWSNLPPDEQKALRERAEFRRKRIKEEIDEGIKAAGLELNDEGRQQFAKRYFEERRKIEEQLRKEMEEKRRPLVKEIVGRLKDEFSKGTPAPANDQTSAPQSTQANPATPVPPVVATPDNAVAKPVPQP